MKNFRHRLPSDMKNVLVTHIDINEKWRTLTPLAQNEWMCWVTIVKKVETRREHLMRFQSDIRAGKRRPCCWPGCPHRKPQARKWFGKNVKN